MPTVVMSHNPDVFPEAVQGTVCLFSSPGTLMVGQIRIPGLSVSGSHESLSTGRGKIRGGWLRAHRQPGTRE